MFIYLYFCTWNIHAKININGRIINQRLTIKIVWFHDQFKSCEIVLFQAVIICKNRFKMDNLTVRYNNTLESTCKSQSSHALMLTPALNSYVWALFQYKRWWITNVQIVPFVLTQSFDRYWNFYEIMHLQYSNLKIFYFKHFLLNNLRNLLGIDFVFATHPNTSQRKKLTHRKTPNLRALKICSK